MCIRDSTHTHTHTHTQVNEHLTDKGIYFFIIEILQTKHILMALNVVVGNNVLTDYRYNFLKLFQKQLKNILTLYIILDFSFIVY